MVITRFENEGMRRNILKISGGKGKEIWIEKDLTWEERRIR